MREVAHEVAHSTAVRRDANANPNANPTRRENAIRLIVDAMIACFGAFPTYFTRTRYGFHKVT